MKAVIPWETFVKLEAAAIREGDGLVAQAARAADRNEYHEAVSAIMETIRDHNFSRAAAATALSFLLCAVITEVVTAAVERIAHVPEGTGAET